MTRFLKFPNLDAIFQQKKDTLNPLLVENGTNVANVKSQIEESFQNFIAELSKQKIELFEKLDQIHDEK